MRMVHVIDDDEVYRKVLVEMVGANGFSTREFGSGFEYLQYAGLPQYLRPDMIFSDMNMPGMSGLEMLRKLADIYPDIPCFIVTGNIDQFDQLDLISSSVREVLCKPVTGSKIAALLEHYKSGRVEMTMPSSSA